MVNLEKMVIVRSLCTTRESNSCPSPLPPHSVLPYHLPHDLYWDIRQNRFLRFAALHRPRVCVGLCCFVCGWVPTLCRCFLECVCGTGLKYRGRAGMGRNPCSVQSLCCKNAASTKTTKIITMV